VRIAAPQRMDLDTIRVYAISKLGWIRQQQKKFDAQERESPRDYINRERHYFLGKRYLLKVIEHDSPPKVEVKQSTLNLYVRLGTDKEKRQTILQEWYREELRTIAQKTIEEWEKKMGLTVSELGIKKMKTKWGTCNIEARRIWLNLELAKKPLHCIEYIIVHEMVHLLERHHNEKFITYMNHFLPQWRHLKGELNRGALGHVEWGY
jgi:predicted metal-dependent hydrolase